MNKFLITNACNLLIQDTIAEIKAAGNPDAGGVYAQFNTSGDYDKGDWMVYVVRTRAPGEAREQVA